MSPMTTSARRSGDIAPQTQASGVGQTTATSVLELRGVTKRFGDHVVVSDFSADVAPGEMFTLLGPSGCGKTTTLRQIAGLDQPDSGEIWYRGRCVAAPERSVFVAPHKRDMGMVFQSYAIWPHLTVFENVAYPLEARKRPKAEIRDRVDRVLTLVSLDDRAARSASTLSGGQQQRVALARALVYEPDLLLLDEPFSNLDAKLRAQMCLELKELQARLDVAVVMVTHDQDEALALSDRIAVMSDGRTEQIGAPEHVYDDPATPFVRDFIGDCVTAPAMIVEVGDGQATLKVQEWGDVLVRSTRLRISEPRAGQAVDLAIRPEAISLRDESEVGAPGVVAGRTETVMFEGNRYRASVLIGEQRVVVQLPRSRRWSPGDLAALLLPSDAVTTWER